jgi:23S rRNA (cytosine1962-C5)-methyltransferase
MKTIRLRAGRERSLLRRHPWIFDGAIERGSADLGETVRVESQGGDFLAWAAFSPASKYRARVWSFEPDERIDAAFFQRRVDAALRAREHMAIQSDGRRLVHGESDGLPGLVVDRYGDTLVAQFLSAGAQRWKGVLADALLRATGRQRLYERSDAGAREREGLTPASGWIGAGGVSIPDDASGETDAGKVLIQEHGWKFSVDVAHGHKTGFYLDQRDNRRKFADYVLRMGLRRVLNCYCYSGGFTVAALAGMPLAEVVSVDSSAPALLQAQHNLALNGLAASNSRWLDADVNQQLRAYIAQGRCFDAIVLDPPKLAPTAAHAERAARAYKDINRLALLLLEPGGLLFTFSCSGGVDPVLFHKIVASAGSDAGVDGFIVERLGGAPDHPMTLAFPEGEYLKGLAVIRK